MGFNSPPHASDAHNMVPVIGTLRHSAPTPLATPVSDRSHVATYEAGADVTLPPELAHEAVPQAVFSAAQPQPEFAKVNLPVIKTLKAKGAQPFTTHSGQSRDAFMYNVAGSFVNSQITSLFLLP